jgi:uncharacterized Zn finger protein
MSWWRYKPYVSAAARRAKAEKSAARLAKGGRKLSPVTIAGRAMATTFWGKAWCDNLEAYSDFANRLPRGRTYARNGSVLDLQIEPGRVIALVSGSDLYKVSIKITPHAASAWKNLKTRCAGQIGSLIELLQGKFSKYVMDLVTQRNGGLFPKPAEIEIKCSCPDWAGLCKHAAAVLYGVGARFDHEPELLFALRKVDHLELIGEAGSSVAFTKSATKGKKVLADADLADVFGIEIAGSETQTPPPAQAVDSKPSQSKSKQRKPVVAESRTVEKRGSVKTRRAQRKTEFVAVAAVGGGEDTPKRTARKRTASNARPRARSAK